MNEGLGSCLMIGLGIGVPVGIGFGYWLASLQAVDRFRFLACNTIHAGIEKVLVWRASPQGIRAAADDYNSHEAKAYLRGALDASMIVLNLHTESKEQPNAK